MNNSPRRRSLWIWLAAALFILTAGGLYLAFPSATAPAAKKPVTAQAAEKDKESKPPKKAAISAEVAHAAGIVVEVAGPATIREISTFYGSIKPNGEREQELRARYPGIVRTVSKRVGEKVGKGEALIVIEANESLQTYTIKSPIAGTVIERNVNPGGSAGSETILMKVTDLGTVWAEFAVFARDLGRVRAGLPVQVSGPDSQQKGDTEIVYMASAGDADTRSVIARAVLDNTGGTWIPGQFAVADVVIAAKPVDVAVARSAIQNLDGKTVVFVETAKGFEARPVSLGKQSKATVEISEGMKAGDRYAAANSYVVKADLLKGDAGDD
jgi:cobalt-zinc-cadmium efflux system membrane fusion protein